MSKKIHPQASSAPLSASCPLRALGKLAVQGSITRTGNPWTTTPGRGSLAPPPPYEPARPCDRWEFAHQQHDPR